MQEITIDVEGVPYTVEYSTHMDGGDEMVVVYLPNGDPRPTVLRGGMTIKSAATTHVRSYVRLQKFGQAK